MDSAKWLEIPEFSAQAVQNIRASPADGRRVRGGHHGPRACLRSRLRRPVEGRQGPFGLYRRQNPTSSACTRPAAPTACCWTRATAPNETASGRAAGGNIDVRPGDGAGSRRQPGHILINPLFG